MVFNILVSNDDDHLRNMLLFDARRGSAEPAVRRGAQPQVAQERILHLSVAARQVGALDNALAGAGRLACCRRMRTDHDRVVAAFAVARKL